MMVAYHGKNLLPFPFAGERTYDMEINLILRIRPVILREAPYQAVEPVPIVHLRHTDQVQLV